MEIGQAAVKRDACCTDDERAAASASVGESKYGGPGSRRGSAADAAVEANDPAHQPLPTLANLTPPLAPKEDRHTKASLGNVYAIHVTKVVTHNKLASQMAATGGDNWRLFNMLEEQGERDVVHMCEMLQQTAAVLGGDPQEAKAAQDASGPRTTVEPLACCVELPADYAGPTVHFPVTMEDCIAVMNFVAGGGILHYDLVSAVLREFHRVVSELPNLVQVTIPEGTTLTIVGDIHGQLKDLLYTFKIRGMPSETNHFLFNGDFVDRGDKGVEVFVLLALLKLACPAVVHMNRGNHEDQRVNIAYGFQQEVCDKYCEPGAVDVTKPACLCGLFGVAFRAIPLAALVNKQVFVVHGGLSEYLKTPRDLVGFSRNRDPSGVRGEDPELALFQDLLWSDPQDRLGIGKSYRGAGIMFGRDVTQSFCEDNNIKLVIRSHECIPEGFQYVHGGRILTIFSASNYISGAGNKGAVAILDHNLRVKFEQYFLAPETAVVIDAAADRHRVLEHRVVGMLLERIALLKFDLFSEFVKLDTEHCGKVALDTWASVMANAMKLDLPWQVFAPKLTTVTDGMVDYRDFVQRYQLHDREGGWQMWMSRFSRRVGFLLVKRFTKLSELKTVFQVDADMHLQYLTFVQVLQSLHSDFTLAQIFHFVTEVVGIKGGLLCFDALLRAVSVVVSADLKTVRLARNDVELAASPKLCACMDCDHKVYRPRTEEEEEEEGGESV